MGDLKGLTHRVEFAGFEVLKSLQNGLSISEISKYRKTSRQAVYKVLKTLDKRGMILKVKNGVYELTQSGIEGLHSFVAFRYKLRQHNINFKIAILSSPKNWDKQRHKLTQLPYFNKKIVLKNNEQELFNFGKVQVRTTTKSIIVKIPTIYTKTPEEAIVQSFGCLYEIIPKIEKLFSISLIKDYKANITVISQEYASLNDALAKVYRKEGNQLLVTDEEGKIWMITDFSFSNDETEFISSERSVDDTTAIMPNLNLLRNNPNLLKNHEEKIGTCIDMITQVTENQLMFNKNFESHVKAVQDLGSSAEANAHTVVLLAETIKDLRDEVVNLRQEISSLRKS